VRWPANPGQECDEADNFIVRLFFHLPPVGGVQEHIGVAAAIGFKVKIFINNSGLIILTCERYYLQGGDALIAAGSGEKRRLGGDGILVSVGEVIVL